jgi:flavin-dependent dehydrogenase
MLAGEVTWDVIIVGAGTAGAATAITLAKLGQRVLLIDEQEKFKASLGESMPPASIDLVKHFLGDEENWSFNFYRSAGNLSAWVSDQPDLADFFFSGNGKGLCIDRLAFDEALRSRALDAGVTIRRGAAFVSCTRFIDRQLWAVKIKTKYGEEQIDARYIVDGSGRRAMAAKSLGVQQLEIHDQLFAYAQSFVSHEIDDDRFTRIEATPNGWWYTNRIPNPLGRESKRLVMFYSDKDLPEAKMAGNTLGFCALMNEAPLIVSLLKTKAYVPTGKIRGAPANSQRLQACCGDSWLAVGDAMQAFDPLSSQGIDKALRSGSSAGHFIFYALTDSAPQTKLDSSNPYICQYIEQQLQSWQKYVKKRDYFYTMQNRWRDRPFWSRRNRPQP